MSNFDGAHKIVPYVQGTKPFQDQRLATITYKKDKDTQIKPPSVAVSIPQLPQSTIKERIDSFLPSIHALCVRTQDAIIRDIHESGGTVVSDADISVDSIIEYLNAESAGGRLRKEDVTNWFDTEIADPLAVALASKMGVTETPTQEESDRIEELMKGIRDSIGSLTAGNTKFDPDTCKVLKKAVGFAPYGDPIAVKMNARLDTMMKIVPKNFADAL